MSIQNLNTFDPFADAIKSSEDDVQDGLVHVRIQQRNGRKTLTTVQGLSSEYDLKKIVRACKKEFACNGDAIKSSEDDVQDGLVHVRIQQRNGRKTLTTVQGLSSEYDLKKIVRACKKEFACNGTVVEHPEYGEVLQLQGDQR
ncbi:hypothetical protein MZE11_19540, partial [Bacillus amyloliquefaciens]|nr:hypothetical protein [Bacillus amyloliquefaciens]